MAHDAGHGALGTSLSDVHEWPEFDARTAHLSKFTTSATGWEKEPQPSLATIHDVVYAEGIRRGAQIASAYHAYEEAASALQQESLNYSAPYWTTSTSTTPAHPTGAGTWIQGRGLVYEDSSSAALAAPARAVSSAADRAGTSTALNSGTAHVEASGITTAASTTRADFAAAVDRFKAEFSIGDGGAGGRGHLRAGEETVPTFSTVASDNDVFANAAKYEINDVARSGKTAGGVSTSAPHHQSASIAPTRPSVATEEKRFGPPGLAVDSPAKEIVAAKNIDVGETPGGDANWSTAFDVSTQQWYAGGKGSDYSHVGKKGGTAGGEYYAGKLGDHDQDHYAGGKATTSVYAHYGEQKADHYYAKQGTHDHEQHHGKGDYYSIKNHYYNSASGKGDYYAGAADYFGKGGAGTYGKGGGTDHYGKSGGGGSDYYGKGAGASDYYCSKGGVGDYSCGKGESEYYGKGSEADYYGKGAGDTSYYGKGAGGDAGYYSKDAAYYGGKGGYDSYGGKAADTYGKGGKWGGQGKWGEPWEQGWDASWPGGKNKGWKGSWGADESAVTTTTTWKTDGYVWWQEHESTVKGGAGVDKNAGAKGQAKGKQSWDPKQGWEQSWEESCYQRGKTAGAIAKGGTGKDPTTGKGSDYGVQPSGTRIENPPGDAPGGGSNGQDKRTAQQQTATPDNKGSGGKTAGKQQKGQGKKGKGKSTKGELPPEVKAMADAQMEALAQTSKAIISNTVSTSKKKKAQQKAELAKQRKLRNPLMGEALERVEARTVLVDEYHAHQVDEFMLSEHVKIMRTPDTELKKMFGVRGLDIVRPRRRKHFKFACIYDVQIQDEPHDFTCKARIGGNDGENMRSIVRKNREIHLNMYGSKEEPLVIHVETNKQEAYEEAMQAIEILLYKVYLQMDAFAVDKDLICKNLDLEIHKLEKNVDYAAKVEPPEWLALWRQPRMPEHLLQNKLVKAVGDNAVAADYEDPQNEDEEAKPVFSDPLAMFSSQFGGKTKKELLPTLELGKKKEVVLAVAAEVGGPGVALSSSSLAGAAGPGLDDVGASKEMVGTTPSTTAAPSGNVTPVTGGFPAK